MKPPKHFEWSGSGTSHDPEIELHKNIRDLFLLLCVVCLLVLIYGIGRDYKRGENKSPKPLASSEVVVDSGIAAGK
jgi:hypothetical protein